MSLGFNVSMEKDKNFFGYKAAIGAFLVIFVNLGACTTLGIFLPTLVQYSGHSLGAVGQIGTVNTIGNVILSLVCVKLMRKIGARYTMLISIIACAIHFNLYTFTTPGANISSLIFMYAAGLTASISITFGTHAVCSSVIADWFVEKRESISGWVLSGAGFGAAIWVFAAGQLLKVTDFKNCYRILSIFIIVIGLFAVIYLIKNPKKLGQKPLGWEKVEDFENQTKEGIVNASGVEYKSALKTPAFWVLALALLFSVMGSCAFLAYSPSWWQINGMSSTGAANWNAIYLLLAGISLMVSGVIFRKFGASVFSSYVHICFVLCLICMLILSTSMVTYMLVLTVVFGAISYPIIASIPALITQTVFGMKEFAAISATLMTVVYVGQAVSSPIMAFFLATEGGMASAWKFFCVTAIVGMILILVAIRISPMKKLPQ